MAINLEFISNIIFSNLEKQHKFNILINRVLYINLTFIQFYHICVKLLEDNTVF